MRSCLNMCSDCPRRNSCDASPTQDSGCQTVQKTGQKTADGRRRVETTQASGRHVKVMDLILVLEGIAIVVFTAAVLWIFRKTGSEPTALVYSFFGVMGVESGIMGWIKNVKERQQVDQINPASEESTSDLDHFIQKGEQR